VKITGRQAKIVVSSDGSGIISQSGGLLLLETVRVTGLDGALSAGLARWRRPRAVHDPGKIVADLAVTLALGGDCLADIAMLRSQPELFGLVASDPTVSRLVDALAADPVRALKAIRAARAADPDRSGRDDRDRSFGEGAGHADLEKDVWVPSVGGVRRPRSCGRG
jgi:hypothetical protein